MTKILLVEDDKSLREIYGVRLLAEGYDIVSAGDGEDALAMAIKERPQLIVSDVMMPKISGFDMLDILRSTTETKDIKVIIMTALSSEDQRARGESLGADRYLVKSQVGIEDVVRTVHEVLGDAPIAGTSAQSFAPPARPAPSAPVRSPQLAAQQPSRPLAPVPSHQQQPTPSFQQSVATPSNSPVPHASLPQPTAPFSTTRPANLGERVIHPITPPGSPTQSSDLSSRIDEELGKVTAPAAPLVAPPSDNAFPPPPPAPPAPNPNPPQSSEPSTSQPASPAPKEESGISFEETPRSAPSSQPQPGFTPGPQPPRP